MRARPGIAVACALGLIAQVAVAGPATARTTASHFTAVGPGVQADWVNGNVTTDLFVFDQLNAPGSRGFFEEVIVVRSGFEGTQPWQAVYDSWDAPVQPAMDIRQPLVSATVEATLPLVSCDGCPAGLPDEIDVAEVWTGVGPIERLAGPDSSSYLDNDPGVVLDLGRSANFLRDATLADADPFAGALGALGELDAARFFDVHITSVLICHPDVDCE